MYITRTPRIVYNIVTAYTYAGRYSAAATVLVTYAATAVVGGSEKKRDISFRPRRFGSTSSARARVAVSLAAPSLRSPSDRLSPTTLKRTQISVRVFCRLGRSRYPTGTHTPCPRYIAVYIYIRTHRRVSRSPSVRGGIFATGERSSPVPPQSTSATTGQRRVSRARTVENCAGTNRGTLS